MIEIYKGQGVSAYLEKMLYYGLYVEKFSAKPTFIDLIRSVQLREENFYNHHDYKFYKIKCCNLYVSYDNNKPIGWVFSYEDEEFNEIVYWRYIRIDYRGNGLSKELMGVATNDNVYKDSYNILRSIKLK